MPTKDPTDAELLVEIAAARARAAQEEGIEPRAVEAHFDPEHGRIVLELTNGCAVAIPAGEFGALEGASTEQIAAVEVQQDGESVHWEDLDADVSVPGIIARMLRLPAWSARLMGQQTSEAKRAAARINGRKGGRPRKKEAEAGSTPP